MRETEAEAARLAALARGGDDAGDDPLGEGAVRVQPLLEGGADGAVHRGLDLGVVEAVLGLALELGIGDEDREDAHDAFADVLVRDLHAPRRELVGLQVVPDGLVEPGAQAVLVASARAVVMPLT